MPETWRLDDTVCLVTGATEGIGLAAARTLAQRGGHVILTGKVDDDRLQKRVWDLQQLDHSVEGLVCDVASAEQVSACYRHVFQTHGRLDVLIANAGILDDARIGMITEEVLERTLQTNLQGVIRHIQAAARLMLRAQSGSIVAMSSIVGTSGNAGQIAYSASKAGVIGAVRSAAKELAPANIRVNAVAPGFISTRMTSHLSSKIYQERIDQIGMGRPGSPQEIAELIGFLASDAASYITGQVIGIDGQMVI